ncbi:hypothetical protein ACFE04_024229 [Oxalis oulophora]
MPHRELSTLNSQLKTHNVQGKFHTTLSLFRDMLRTCPWVNSYTFTPVMGACSALLDAKCGKQVHGLMIKNGTETGTVSKTALMNMYSKMGYSQECVKVFEELEVKDVVTWNALLSVFLRQGAAKKALGVLVEMRKEKVEYSDFTFCSALKACTLIKASRQGKQVHGLVVVRSRDLVVLGTALVDLYSEIGCITEAIKIFSALPGKKDDVSRNSMLSACVKNRKFKDAFFIMRQMRPNVNALTTSLSACSENSDLWTGKQIHSVAIRFGFISDTQLCNALVDMYAKSGKITYSRTVFDRIFRKDVVSYSCMINAYGVNGEGDEAFAIFKKMDDVAPNSVTFLSILSAFSHSGTMEHGWECFNLMREKYSISPDEKHYACFMDGLGRAGKLDDMWLLYNDMVKHGVKPTRAIWATLLNGCNHNQDISRGEFAAKQLLELGLDSSSEYVLVSNFYAAIEKWDIVDNLRSSMRKLWPNKEAGTSWVDADGSHENVANL